MCGEKEITKITEEREYDHINGEKGVGRHCDW